MEIEQSYDRQFARMPETVVITGAATGIGRAAAEIMGASGTRNIGLLDTNAEGLAEVAETLSSTGCQVHTEVLSVADQAAVHQAFRNIAAKHGTPNAVLHFAGISSRIPFAEVNDENADPLLAINLKGSMWIAQAALEQMCTRPEGGAIVLTSSVSARRGPVHSNVTYACSKGGVNALTRVLARQYGKYNIRVNTISPGQIKTPLSTVGWGTDPEVIREKQRVRDEVAKAEVPLGRVGDAHEAARAAIFLATDAASYITGEVLEVNGGFYFD